MLKEWYRQTVLSSNKEKLLYFEDHMRVKAVILPRAVLEQEAARVAEDRRPINHFENGAVRVPVQPYIT